MKAVVYHGVGDVRLDDVADPRVEKPDDVVVRLTASAICGTDLHFIRGTFPGMEKGTILGHEGVGIIEEVGRNVRNLKSGDRVVIPSTIACGNCVYCRAGYYSQCDVANPNGKSAGTAFFGGPKAAGGFHGLQAEFARIPYANGGLVKLPEEVSDDQAILLSDIFPTAWFGAEMARIKPGHTVAVFGCGIVGQFAIASAKLMNAGRIFAIDMIPSRLERALAQGAEIINFNEEDPVEMIMELTNGIGVDCAIDCVGVDAECAHHGPATKKAKNLKAEFDRELKYVAPEQNPDGKNWLPGNAPTQALRWMVESVAKAGTLSVVGVYPPNLMVFPIGQFMNKNLRLNAGNCHHRKYIPTLLERVRMGGFDPAQLISRHESMNSAIDAYREFDRREAGWLKVELKPEEISRRISPTKQEPGAHIH